MKVSPYFILFFHFCGVNAQDFWEVKYLLKEKKGKEKMNLDFVLRNIQIKILRIDAYNKSYPPIYKSFSQFLKI